MPRLQLVLITVVVACGDRTPPPTTVTPAPAPVVTATAPPAAHHEAPTCPLPPLATANHDDEPHEGLEGESRIAKPPHGDRCGIADSNLARVEQAIVAKPNASKPAASKPWNHKRKLEYAQLVERRLALSPDETRAFDRNGFVVLPRMTFANYASAFHEVYQSQLPLYVSVDAILHAIYAGNDSLIADLEDARLRPELASVLDQLACTLPAAAADYPPDAARDLDLYLAVSRALLRGEEPASMFGDPSVEDLARKLVKHAVAADEMTTVDLFGRPRVIDFTAYTPRSHYAKTDERQRYFRAGMWLSRLEFNLVSRSSRSSQPGDAPDPSETPREAVDALALADLIERAHQGGEVGKLDTAWALLAGRREDVSIAQLGDLRRAAGIAKLTDPDAAAKLRAAIGDKFQRTARLHYMPQGSPILPAIATLLGPRVVPDAAATRPLVNDAIAERNSLTASDMAFVLGHDRALEHLKTERAKFPTLDKQLLVARDIVAKAPRGKDDLYSAWLDAVLGLAHKPTGTLPSFMATPAYADLHLSSALAAFGHIKHNFVLIAGESYFAGGCEIPDGYVEPAPATYDALLDYAARGERAFAALDPQDALGGHAYFVRLASILRVLRQIQSDELADRPLNSDERSFLSMVAEMAPGTTGGPPTYTGWWFDLFRQRELDGLATSEYIASFFTGETIAYVGATSPRLGVFAVDTGGAPRMMVGPVTRAYEYQGPVAHRLDDAAGSALADKDRIEPWAASYVVAAPPEPKLSLHWYPGDPKDKGITIETKDALGPVTVEFYDHHRVAIKKLTKQVKPGKTVFALTAKDPEGIHLQVGAYNGWFDSGVVEAGVWQKLGGYEGDSD